MARILGIVADRGTQNIRVVYLEGGQYYSVKIPRNFAQAGAFPQPVAREIRQATNQDRGRILERIVVGMPIRTGANHTRYEAAFFGGVGGRLSFPMESQFRATPSRLNGTF